MGAESEVWRQKSEEGSGKAFVCGSAAGNGGIGMVRHLRRTRGLRSKVQGGWCVMGAESEEESGRALCMRLRRGE